MNILYIILKHVIWRFQIYNLFREIFKFRDDKSNNVFRETGVNAFVKPRNLNFSQNKLYIWNLQITRFKMIFMCIICLCSKSLKFFRTSENGLNSAYFAEIAHKIAKPKYFPNIFDDSDSPINSLSDDI